MSSLGLLPELGASIIYSVYVILGITYGIGLGLHFQMLFQDQQMMLIFYVEVLLGKIWKLKSKILKLKSNLAALKM